MPSERHKITGKSNMRQDAERVKVKSEPIDILPLSGYVDDRVELIKQAFLCLKPKSVRAIAPDFLQNKLIEKIQEECLNEVLGMSKKRLLSIINATKCPTDTDSSSDEESVQQIEAHISLDEISSEDERPKGRKKTHKRQQKEETKQATAKKDTANPPEGKKEYSVLELLELQARARAIRSQLALEPVTKIEIKESDEEDEFVEQPSQINPPKRPSVSQPTSVLPSALEMRAETSKGQSSVKLSGGRTVRIVKTTVPESNSNIKEFSRNGLERDKVDKSAEQSGTSERRIKLKRNWRKRSIDDESGKNNPANFLIEVKNTMVEEIIEEQKRTSEDERSNSPDVLPIIASPETLCISSDTDEEVVNTKVKPVTEKSPRDTVESQKETTPHKEVTPDATKDEVLEEGEVLDELDINIQEDVKNLEEAVIEKSDEPLNKETEDESDGIAKESHTVDGIGKYKTLEEEKKQVTDDEKSDDDLNDDCIEIVCTDILDEHQDNTDNKDLDNQNKTEADEEILDLNGSSDEDNLPLSQLVGDKKLSPTTRNSKIESWNSRWLESSRVSKIMATSRLGNSVRRAIKTKTKKQKEFEENDSNSGEESQKQPLETSNAEEGSEEQYRELLEKQQ